MSMYVFEHDFFGAERAAFAGRGFDDFIVKICAQDKIIPIIEFAGPVHKARDLNFLYNATLAKMVYATD